MENSWIRGLKRILIAPLGLIGGAVEGIDRDEIRRIVDKRIARAESAVLRDYLAQKGMEGDELESAISELKQERQASVPSEESVRALEQRAVNLEQKLRDTRVESSARLALSKLGIADEYAGDVLKLAEDGLRAARECKGGEAAVEASISSAIESVVARLPGLVGEVLTPSVGGAGYAGSAGNYPRADTTGSMQQALDHARQAGDNTSAVAIISQAAKKGIRLR